MSHTRQGGQASNQANTRRPKAWVTNPPPTPASNINAQHRRTHTHRYGRSTPESRHSDSKTPGASALSPSPSTAAVAVAHVVRVISAAFGHGVPSPVEWLVIVRLWSISLDWVIRSDSPTDPV